MRVRVWVRTSWGDRGGGGLLEDKRQGCGLVERGGREVGRKGKGKNKGKGKVKGKVKV